MSHIDISCSEFSGPYAAINGQYTQSVDVLSLVRGIVTVGVQKESDLTAYGVRSIQKHLGLSLLAASVVDFTPDGCVVNDLFRSLDGSEKSSVSYWLGMAFAKLVAEFQLGIAWLGHADAYLRTGAARLVAGSKARGDLIGRDLLGYWHVAEAKGRSSSVETQLMANAKRQAANIGIIYGRPPRSTFVCITRLFDSPVRMLIEDPPPQNKKSQSIEIQLPDFFRQYYAPIISFLKENAGTTVGRSGRRFRMAPLVSMPSQSRELYIGLPVEIFEHPEEAAELLARTSDDLQDGGSPAELRLESHGSRQVSLGLDGILVEGRFAVGQ